MAKGLDKHKERLAELSSFGKDLARRSGSKCELCSAYKVSLEVFEVHPVKEEPDYDSCLFIWGTCKEQLDNPKKLDANHWHFLNDTIWSEIISVKVLSVRVLKKIAVQERWGQELQEQVYLEPEEEEWVEA